MRMRMPSFRSETMICRALLLGALLLLVSSLPAAGRPGLGSATAHTAAGGRVVASPRRHEAALALQRTPDGGNAVSLLQDARYPGPAPDGRQFAFVRSSGRGAAIFAHSLEDSSDRQLVARGQFLALAYPRFSPDGQALAFAAIGLLT